MNDSRLKLFVVTRLFLFLVASSTHNLGNAYQRRLIFGARLQRAARVRVSQRHAVLSDRYGLLDLRGGASGDSSGKNIDTKEDDDEGLVDDETVDGTEGKKDDKKDPNDKKDENGDGGNEEEFEDGDEEDEDEEEEEDEDDEEVDEDDGEEDEDDEEEDEDVDEDDQDGDDVGGHVKTEVSAKKYDEILLPSPFTSIYVAFGVMMVARRLDLTSPIVNKIARVVYILYLVCLQLFLLFVRIKAKEANDRTPVNVSNPLSAVLQNQLDGLAGGAGSMMKTLASSLLSSTTTVLEYDLKEANSMQRGLLFNMAFLWFLHFKMKQVQPIMLQTASGFLNIFYSPLFQVYVLGRNLERPFKTLSKSFADSTEEAKLNDGSPTTTLERRSLHDHIASESEETDYGEHARHNDGENDDADDDDEEEEEVHDDDDDEEVEGGEENEVDD